ncbi:uncharacterized protein BX663DRAFT_513832 [Cokeromyces recurvatus]|uniref:uncharacterized protein n=1 Tax=Cokeromyces recurvatus TaxID=90255 RepID=UPI00221F4BF6|nr:uncharacterized protein BX663DRAFT_513832 [Cokeromyces recurvatus]KAI7901725.1 hypothetical protein BX663DRAFT_513832 [Cokeromyces recurvatus]
MIRPFIIHNQIIHSRNPYIHKCCGCIHLRIGAFFSCLIWMGLSLYFTILSFQAKSPFYTQMSDNNTGVYLFGLINLIFFTICLGSLIPIYLRSANGMRIASLTIFILVFILLLDTFINTVLFIVQKDNYIQHCSDIDLNPYNLDFTILDENRFIGKEEFFNCNKTWENELKFTILSTIIMIITYSYWTITIYSFTRKLNLELKTIIYRQMSHMPSAAIMGNIIPPQRPIVTGADIML